MAGQAPDQASDRASGLRQTQMIETYGAGGFRVSGQRIEGAILLLEDVVKPWAVSTLAALDPSDFADILRAGLVAVEFVLLGTGLQTAIAPRQVRDVVKEAGLGLEMMNTPEACRLYNVLAADGRRVAAALLAV
jgi:uncharacterized protein